MRNYRCDLHEITAARKVVHPGLIAHRSTIRIVTRPTSHHLVTVSSGSTFELDWSYPDRQLAFEMDGYGVHLRSLEAFEHDRFGRNELEINGWTVLNFSRRQVERAPAKVIDQVRRLLGRRVR